MDYSAKTAGAQQTVPKIIKLLAFFLFFLFPIAVLFTSCNFPAGLPVPLSSEQIPTVIAMTLAAQGIQPKTITPDVAVTGETSPTPTLQLPLTDTAIPSPTQTEIPILTDIPTGSGGAPPAGIPAGTIQFLSPGPGSLVTSPFTARISVRPVSNATVRVELLGEDGRLLMREVKVYDLPHNQGVLMGQEILFAISAVAETARLQVIVEDEHDRLAAVASLELLLLSLGNPDLAQPGDGLENIVISEPKGNALIQGGVMRVSGLARLRETQPLLIELRTEDGRIVGTRQVTVTPVPGRSYGTFEIDVPYSVSTATRVRLAVWEPGVSIPGIVHLSSLEVMLSP